MSIRERLMSPSSTGGTNDVVNAGGTPNHPRSHQYATRTSSGGQTSRITMAGPEPPSHDSLERCAREGTHTQGSSAHLEVPPPRHIPLIQVTDWDERLAPGGMAEPQSHHFRMQTLEEESTKNSTAYAGPEGEGFRAPHAEVDTDDEDLAEQTALLRTVATSTRNVGWPEPCSRPPVDATVSGYGRIERWLAERGWKLESLSCFSR